MSSEIVKAESGPKRAERPPLSYVKTPCSGGCGKSVYFFKMERHACCLECGSWTEKPKNAQVITL